MLLVVVLWWLLSVLWPVKSLLLPQNWWGTSLIVVMNDNEARPCGGFATAYGELKLPLFKLNIGSTYRLDKDLGPAPAPLDQVSDRLKFWDLGTSTNLRQCAEDFENGYLKNTDTAVARVILVQMSFLEKWAKILGQDDFFAQVSREVADIDHHDETSLETRKDPAGEMVGSFVKKTVFNPFKWRSFTRLIGKHPAMFRQSKHDADISIAEWNLGGGKSSRYLRKKWALDIQESAPGDFSLTLRLTVDHLGGYDAPLSQDWKGGFWFKFMELEAFIPATIKAGERWTHAQTYPANINDLNKLNLYTPSYQHWHTDVSFSAFPQQKITSKVLKTRESVGHWSGKIRCGGKSIDWRLVEDDSPIFLTLHKPIDSDLLGASVKKILNWSEGDLIVELHFNEPFKVGNLKAALTDRDHTVTAVTENLTMKHPHQLGLTTLLLNFNQNQYQKDERFYLSLEGVTDVWGNAYANEPRTVITR